MIIIIRIVSISIIIINIIINNNIIIIQHLLCKIYIAQQSQEFQAYCLTDHLLKMFAKKHNKCKKCLQSVTDLKKINAQQWTINSQFSARCILTSIICVSTLRFNQKTCIKACWHVSSSKFLPEEKQLQGKGGKLKIQKCDID